MDGSALPPLKKKDVYRFLDGEIDPEEYVHTLMHSSEGVEEARKTVRELRQLLEIPDEPPDASTVEGCRNMAVLSRITDGAQMAEVIADFANNVSCDVEGFVEQVTMRTHRTVQQSLMGLFLRTIGAWAKMDSYDLRDQATITIAKKIAEMFPNEVEHGLPYV